jgi:hypothetical protein
MKAFFTALLVLSCGSAAVYAQGVTSHVAESRVEQLKWLSPTGSPIHGFDNRTSEVKGSPYLFDSWVEGNITTNSGKKVDSLEINYDILNHLVEIKVNKVVKAASEAEINGFSIMDEHGQKRNFISLSEYHLPDEKLVGFAEVLFKGNKISLIKKYEIKYVEPNYVEHFDVGSLDAQLLKKDNYFLLRENKLEEFHKRKSFGDKKKAVKAFVRKNGLDLRNERDIIYTVEHFNTLL